MKKTIAMLLAAVLCTASLTACGSGSDTKSESSAAQSSAALQKEQLHLTVKHRPW